MLIIPRNHQINSTLSSYDDNIRGSNYNHQKLLKFNIQYHKKMKQLINSSSLNFPTPASQFQILTIESLTIYNISPTDVCFFTYLF